MSSSALKSNSTTASRSIAPELAARFQPAARRASRASSSASRERGLLGGRSVYAAASQFHALCEGLAALELRGVFIAGTDPERQWREALSALIHGFALSPTAEQATPRRVRSQQGVAPRKPKSEDAPA